MKVETAIQRILLSDKDAEIKKMKLYTLAFKQVPGSPNQQKVKDALDAIWRGQK